MVPTPLQLIAAIQPGFYCARAVVDQVSRTTTNQGFLAAAALATPRESNPVGTECASLLDPFDVEGLEHPLVRRRLARNAPADALASICSSLIDSLSVVCPRVANIEIIQETRSAGSSVGTSPMLPGACAGRARIDAKILCPSSGKAPATESGRDSFPSPAAGCRSLQVITFLVRSRYEPGEDIALEVLPRKGLQLHERAHYSVLLLELIFHGPPSVGLNSEGGVGGRAELIVVSLSLNEAELRLLRRLIDQEAIAGRPRAPRPDSDTEILFRNQAILHAHRLGYRLCQHLGTTSGWRGFEKVD